MWLIGSRVIPRNRKDNQGTQKAHFSQIYPIFKHFKRLCLKMKNIFSGNKPNFISLVAQKVVATAWKVKKRRRNMLKKKEKLA